MEVANMSRVRFLLLAALAFALTGCSVARVEPIRKDVLDVDAEARKRLREMQRPAPPPAPISSDRERGIWLPVRKASEVQSAEQPEAAKRPLVVNREFRTLFEVAERVTALTGVPVVVAPDAASATAGPPPAVAGAQSAQQTLPVVPGIAGAPTPGIGAQAPQPPLALLTYSGPLAGFLDLVGARFGVSWEWHGSGVRFFRYVTRTFHLAALPGDLTLQSTISNQNGSAAGGTGTTGAGSTTGTAATSSSQQTGVAFTGMSIWRAVEDSIRSMLSSAGRVTVTAATGTVTVTDTPQIVAQVERFIDEQNGALRKQVVVNVRVLTVDLTNADEYGINWDIVYQTLSQNLGWSFASAFPVDASATTLTLRILGTAGSATGSHTSRRWGGSEAMISALSTQGHVAQVTSGSVTTLNNQAAPFQIGRQQSYLAASTTTVAQGVGATTTLQPGLITTGFSMVVVPRILTGGKLMLQYTINLSSLIRISTASSNGSSIQTPEIDTRDFMQRVLLNSGDTLVLTGFEQTTLNALTQGIGDADNVALGGGVRGNRGRAVLVILVQPTILDT